MTIKEGIKDLFDDLTMTQRIVGGAVIVVIIAVAISGGSLISHFRIKGLEKKVADSKAAADIAEWRAAEAENEAARYGAKIEFLEKNLSEIQILARKQDEELEKFSNVLVDARADRERASRVRSIASTADELCKRLGETGRPCQ